MTAHEVIDRFGTWALVKLVAALLVFLALHLVRLPLVLLVRVLALGMTGIDRLIAASITHPNTRSRREPLRHNAWR